MKRLILIAAFILTAGTLAAQNYIIVNSEKVFKSIDAYNTAISDLDKLAKQYQDQVDAKFAEVEALYNNYVSQKTSLSAAARQARDLDPEDGVPYFILAQCYASSAGSCGGFAGLATYWAAYDTMAKAVELLPADSEYMEHAKSSLGKFRSVFPSSEECFFNELQEGARYTVTCGTAAGITTTVRAR